MTQTSRLVLEIDSRDAEQKAADTRKALEALEGAGLRVKPAMDKAGSGIDGAGKSAEAAGKSFSSQREEIDQLLGRIDPLSKKLGELDRQEQELARHRKAGTIELDTYTEYQQKIAATRNDLNRFSDSLTRTGNTAKQTAAALRGVPAQFTDIAVSLQGGQAPLTVFLQQGGQLKDMFGGAGPAAKALGGYILGLVNPFTVAAAAVGVLGLAYYQGSKEQDAFRLSLVSTGNASGTTTGALAEMSRRIGDTVGTTGQAASALAQLAASGKIASSSFEEIAIAAISWEKASGQAVGTTIAEFNKLADDPVKAVAELNEKYNFLTASVYEQVRAAQDQGEKEAAAAIAQEALAKALGQRAATIKENLGSLEKAWRDLAGAAKSGWDAILGVGRESSAGPDLTKLRQEIAYRKSLLDTGFEDDDTRERIKAIESEIAAYEKKSKAEQDSAAAAAHAAQVQRDGQIAYESFQKSIEQNFTKRQKMNKALEEDEKRINAARAAGYIISEEQAAASLKAIRENPIYKESAPKKENSYTEDAGQKMLDQARQQYAVLQQQNSLLGQQGEGSKALGAEAKRLLELEQQIADLKEKKTLTAAQKQILAMADLNIAQQKQNAALERENQLKNTSTEQTQKLLAFQENLNSQLTLAQSGLDQKLAGAGLGDRALQRLQEQQQIQQSYQSQMDRLTYDYNKSDKTTGTTDLYNKETEALRAALQQRLTMQQGYYAAVDQAQSDWSLGASSALQTYAEQANDVAGQTRNLFTNAFGNMEDAVVNFVKTGKLSFKDFADGVVADLIRIQVRQAAAGFLGMAFGAITGGGGAALGPAVMTGSSQTISRVGFSGGGYTGDGGKFEPKGVVHGGEFVVKKEVVSQPGAREFLERMNANSNGYADGGYVNPTPSAASSSTTQSIATNGGSPTITQQFSFQGNPDDATISLVKDAAYQGAKGGYEMVMRDLKQNGPIRQLIARR